MVERDTYSVRRQDLDGLFNWQGIRHNTPRISTPNSANRPRHREFHPTCPSSFVEDLGAPLSGAGKIGAFGNVAGILFTSHVSCTVLHPTNYRGPLPRTRLQVLRG